MANTRCYVLDARSQLTPIGVPGELYLGGDGLARGYLNRPELTAERFVASPFEGGARLYRTGDRVRWRIDGTLEFLGRLDDQVKLRGFRIELGEIEAVLRQCPGVTQSVVVLREDRPGDKRLVGYYVSGDGHSLSHAELTRQASRGTAGVHGAVGLRCAGAAAADAQRQGGSPGAASARSGPVRPRHRHYVPPRTALEELLAAIWTEVLGLERVGIHDNFFDDLGGHSLLAARLVSRIEQRTGKSVPLAMVFREPTVSGLARHLQRPACPGSSIWWSHCESPAAEHRSSGSGTGGRSPNFTDLVPPEHPLYWCKPEYLDGRKLHHTSIEERAGQYCRQLRQLELKGPLVLCGYSFGGLLAYETARQLQELGPEAVLVFMLEPTPPVGMAGRRPGLHETLGQRVAREVRELWSARGGDKLPSSQPQGEGFLPLLDAAFRDCLLRSPLAFRRPVPIRLRWTYALNIYRRTIRDYVPQPIRARLIVVHQEEYMGGRSGLWADLAAGEFHRHVLPSAGHLDFLTKA